MPRLSIARSRGRSRPPAAVARAARLACAARSLRVARGVGGLRAARVLAVLALAALPACSVMRQAQEIARHEADTRRALDERRAAFARSVDGREARAAAQDVDRPWLAGPAQPLARELVLPAALRADVDTTLMFADGPAGLPLLAERLARATGIPVRVRPDCLLPAEAFLPRLAGEAAPVVAMPAEADFEAGARPLPQALDALAARLSVQWRYRDGAIEFYRTETRVFDVRSLTQSARADARLGRTARAGEGGFENTSNTTLAVADQDTLAAVRARIEPFLTRAGTIAAQAGAGSSVVVTDTPDALAGVARFLESENRALTRRVRLVFEEITLIRNDRSEASIDWSALYAGGRAAVAAATPGGAAAEGAASLSAGVAGGPFGDSRALVAALAAIGTVVRHTSVPVLTLNRRPVTHAVRTTFSYIDQVQTTSVGTLGGDGVQGALPSVSISQKEETVGTLLTLVPDAQEDGQVLLSVAYDNTVAQPLRTVTFGGGDNRVQIQQVTIDGNGTVQQVALRPGQPMVISGFDRSQQEYDRRRLDASAPLAAGGVDRAAGERRSTLLVLSARTEEDGS